MEFRSAHGEQGKGLPAGQRGVVRIGTLVGTLAIVALALAAAAASALAGGDNGPGQADVFPADLLEGHLAEQRGRVVVLHFWASWCLPCREEAHSLARFREMDYPRLSAQGLRVLTVNNDLRRSDLDRFMADHPVVFPVYFDPCGHWFDRYGLTGLPGTVVLGPDGAVIDERVIFAMLAAGGGAAAQIVGGALDYRVE